LGTLYLCDDPSADIDATISCINSSIAMEDSDLILGAAYVLLQCFDIVIAIPLRSQVEWCLFQDSQPATEARS